MRRAAAAALVIGTGAALAAPVPSVGMTGADEPVPVSIGFDAFAPPQVDVLVGETVHWTNDSVRVHTVTAEDDSFDSGRLVGTDTFERSFGAPGVVRYYCTIHPSMRGEVDVSELLLDTPAGQAGAGRPFPLTGRAALPQGTVVTIEADAGTGFTAVGSAAVGADGRFAAAIVPATTAGYRAVAGDAASPPVRLVVLDHAVTVSRTVRGGIARYAVRVTPPTPGGRVVLQQRLRERFGWWPRLSTRLDRSSGARFAVRVARGRRIPPARVALTLPDGATELALSRTLDAGPAAR